LDDILGGDHIWSIRIANGAFAGDFAVCSVVRVIIFSVSFSKFNILIDM
jgi:hypothetical protein